MTRLVDGGDEAGAGYVEREGLEPHRLNEQTFAATSPQSTVADQYERTYRHLTTGARI